MNAISAGDTAWVLTSTALVMVMTVGLAFFYGGLVRPKNALNTMMMSIVALGVVSVQWVLVGYSIAFGHGTPWWGGLAWLGFKGVGLEPDAAYGATIPLQAHAMFQLMFAIITPALISGAIVERMRFRAYVVFILLWPRSGLNRLRARRERPRRPRVHEYEHRRCDGAGRVGVPRPAAHREGDGRGRGHGSRGGARRDHAGGGLHHRTRLTRRGRLGRARELYRHPD